MFLQLYFFYRPIVNCLSSKLALVGLLLGHRFLRKLNQTGDKWASLPDISDWLKMPEHQVYLTLIFLAGKYAVVFILNYKKITSYRAYLLNPYFHCFLGLVGVWASLMWLKCATNTIDKGLHICAFLCILLYRNVVGDIFIPYLPVLSR